MSSRTTTSVSQLISRRVPRSTPQRQRTRTAPAFPSHASEGGIPQEAGFPSAQTTPAAHARVLRPTHKTPPTLPPHPGDHASGLNLYATSPSVDSFRCDGGRRTCTFFSALSAGSLS